jgi:NADH-quinone oxidoreductase subunit B
MPPPQRFDPELEQTILLTKAEWLIDWSRKSALWPLGFGLACCAIEMISTAMTRFDISRFGAEVFRATPRQADVMIVAGTVTHKMAPRVRRLWDQMSNPKWVIAMGACTVGGGPYFKYGYHIVKGVDKVVPVDIYLPGCPPRPEALLEAIMRLQELVMARGKLLNDQDPEYTLPEKGSRQAVKDGLSPADPWTTEKARSYDDKKRRAEEEQQRKKAEAAKKKAEEAAAKKAAEEPAAEPATEEPTASKAAEEPTAEPTTEEPTASKAAEEPTAEPATDEPTAKQADEEPTAEPATDEPTAKQADEADAPKKAAPKQADEEAPAAPPEEGPEATEPGGEEAE